MDYGIYMVSPDIIINLLLIAFASVISSSTSLTYPSLGTTSHICPHHQTLDSKVLVHSHDDRFVMWTIMN